MAKRGPAPKGEYAGKSTVFSTRVRPDTKEALVAAAQKSGRALSQEVEHRLQRTFQQDEKIEVGFGGAENYWLMRMIALAMQLTRVPFYEGTDWRNDPLLFDVMLKTVNNLLETLRPPGEIPERPKHRKITEDTTAALWPLALWEWVQSADETLPLNTGTREDHLFGLIKRQLGAGVVNTAVERAKTIMASQEGGLDRSPRRTKSEPKKPAAKRKVKKSPTKGKTPS